MKKTVTIFSLILLFLIILSSQVFALSEIFTTGDNFILDGADQNNTMDTDKINDVSSDVYNIFMAAGIGVIIITGAILGIKFMISSAEEKAEVKESLVPYVISSIVLIGAFGIWKLVITVLNGLA